MTTVRTRDEFDRSDASTTADPWSVDVPDVEQRMLDLVYRVARQVGWSRRSCEQLCLRIVGPRFWTRHRTSVEMADPEGGPGRHTRARVLAMLRAELGSRVDSTGLEHALLAAVTLDEVALLPPRQRFAVWSASVLRRTVEQIAQQAGWTPDQVVRLLNAGMGTVAVWTNPVSRLP